jgi:hypothetical protein
MNVIERIERGEIPRHDTDKVILNHKDFTELLRLAKIGQQMKWVSVAERVPENRQRVLVALKNEYGRIWRTCAEYIAPKTVLAEIFLDEDCEYEEFADYDAEKDCYYAPAGFYESNYCTDENYHIGEKVLAWMPLPPLPGE